MGVGPGSVVEYFGAQDASHAAQNAAIQKQEAAAAERAIIMGEAKRYETDLTRLAASTPQELAILDRSYQSAGEQLSREERLLAAIDPALMEASKQTLSLLRGETADVNKPLTDMRNSQRQNLVNSLRSQYGPGAESTSIGQRALQQFDMESAGMFQQNQQNSLNQVFGMATFDAGARASRGLTGLQTVGQGYSALQSRQLQARSAAGAATLGALSGTSQAIIESAGANQVGAALQGQAQASIGNQWARSDSQLASSALSAYVGKPSSGGSDRRGSNRYGSPYYG